VISFLLVSVSVFGVFALGWAAVKAISLPNSELFCVGLGVVEVALI
jgi:hypothetical protein